jgi:acetylcholinesterase
MALYSTTAQLRDYLNLFMMPHATDKEIDGLLVHYPDDLRAGSPFDTGIKNALGMPSPRRAEAEARAD